MYYSHYALPFPTFLRRASVCVFVSSLLVFFVPFLPSTCVHSLLARWPDRMMSSRMLRGKRNTDDKDNDNEAPIPPSKSLTLLVQHTQNCMLSGCSSSAGVEQKCTNTERKRERDYRNVFQKCICTQTYLCIQVYIAITVCHTGARAHF